MERHQFDRDGLALSYLDAGGDGYPFLLLHAHWMEAATFYALAERLRDRYRVLALDQRGHGDSDHASDYGRSGYLGDVDAWIDHLRIDRPFAILGHSLGGINAIQYAAKRSDRVRAIIIEDIGIEVKEAADFITEWRGTFASREALAAHVGERFAPYLQDSFRHTSAGWTLAFDVDDEIASQRALIGDYWTEWLASTCPALIVHGTESRVTSRTIVDAMAERRPNTQVEHLSGGHAIHLDQPEKFAAIVRSFLGNVL